MRPFKLRVQKEKVSATSASPKKKEKKKELENSCNRIRTRGVESEPRSASNMGWQFFDKTRGRLRYTRSDSFHSFEAR
jgi:hypothetical protein